MPVHDESGRHQDDGGRSAPRVQTPIAVTPDSQPGHPVPDDPASYTAGLDLLRRRRKYFFGVVLGYVPVMWLLHEFAPRFMLKAFAVWVVLLVVAMAVSAVARCPRCGNCFHMHGMTLLYLRKCLHCQLHINADRQP